MSRVVVATVVSLVMVAPAPAGAQHDLVWKWKDGDTFWVETATDVNQLMVVEDPSGDLIKKPEQYRAAVGLAGVAIIPRRSQNDREVSRKFTHMALYRYRVTKANPDGSAVLTQMLQRAYVKGEPNKPETLLAGVELTLHCTSRGVVTKVEGHDKLLDRLAGNDSGRRKVLEQALSETTLKQSATAALGFLPDKPVETGKSWERRAELKLGPLGTLKVTHTGTLDEATKEQAVIRTATRVTGYDPGAVESLVVQVTSGSFATAECKGTVRFDPAAGRLVAAESASAPPGAESEMTLAGTLTVRNGDTTYRTRLTQVQKVRTRLFTKDPSQPQPPPG